MSEKPSKRMSKNEMESEVLSELIQSNRITWNRMLKKMRNNNDTFSILLSTPRINN